MVNIYSLADKLDSSTSLSCSCCCCWWLIWLLRVGDVSKHQLQRLATVALPLISSWLEWRPHIWVRESCTHCHIAIQCQTVPHSLLHLDVVPQTMQHKVPNKLPHSAGLQWPYLSKAKPHTEASLGIYNSIHIPDTWYTMWWCITYFWSKHHTKSSKSNPLDLTSVGEGEYEQESTNMAFQCKMASVSIYTEKEGSQRINKVTTNLQGHHSEAGVYINIYLTNMLSQQTLYSDIGAYVNIQFNKM